MGGDISFFDEYDGLTNEFPQRDQHGHPLLRPAGSPEDAQLVPYVRSSTLADAVCNTHALTIWQLNNVAIGLFRRPELAMLVAGVDLDEDNKPADKESAKLLTSIIARAQEAAGSTAKADRGSAIHSMIQFDNPQPDWAATVTGARQAMLDKGFTPIGDPEVFCACDEIKVAGSFDHMYRHPDLGSVIVDWKTGKLKPVEFAVQISTYARAGARYNRDHSRTPYPVDFNFEKGIVANVLPEGTFLYEVDLVVGYAIAKFCLVLRHAHSAEGNRRLLRAI